MSVTVYQSTRRNNTGNLSLQQHICDGVPPLPDSSSAAHAEFYVNGRSCYLFLSLLIFNIVTVGCHVKFIIIIIIIIISNSN
jgi:hypothetical protein